MSQVTIFERLLNKSTEVNAGKSELLDLYVMLWENGVLLKDDQYIRVLHTIKQKSNESELAKCWYLLTEGFAYTFSPSTGNAFEKLNETIDSFRAINDPHGEGAAQALMTLYYKNLGQLDKAQEYVQNAIQNLGENKNYMYFLGVAYYQAGEIHHLLKDYNSASSI